MELIVGLLLVSGSVIIMERGYRIQFSTGRFDLLSIVFFVLASLTFVSFYVGLRLIGLPFFAITMSYFMIVIPLFVRVVLGRELAEGRALRSKSFAEWLIGASGFLIMSFFTALVCAIIAIELTPDFQIAYNENILRVGELQFTWIETTNYSTEQITAISSRLRQITFGLLYLLPLWVLGSVIILVFRDKYRKNLIIRIEGLRDKGLYLAASALAKEARTQFPADNRISNLKQNVEFLVQKEQRPD